VPVGGRSSCELKSLCDRGSGDPATASERATSSRHLRDSSCRSENAFTLFFASANARNASCGMSTCRSASCASCFLLFFQQFALARNVAAVALASTFLRRRYSLAEITLARSPPESPLELLAADQSRIWNQPRPARSVVLCTMMTRAHGSPAIRIRAHHRDSTRRQL